MFSGDASGWLMRVLYHFATALRGCGFDFIIFELDN